MTPGRPPGRPVDLLHEDGSVCAHGRAKTTLPLQALGAGVGYPCPAGLMIAGIAGMPAAERDECGETDGISRCTEPPGHGPVHWDRRTQHEFT